MKPKLLFVLPDLAAGGAHFMNVRLTQQLQQRGWHVDLAVLFRRDEVIPAETLSGLEVHRFNATTLPTKLAALARLAQLAKRYDLVVGGMEFAALYMDRPVIRRRFHQRNVGMERAMSDPWSEELRVIRRIGYAADALDYAADVIEISQKSAQNLRSRVALMRSYVGWPNMGVLERFRLFIDCLRVGRMRKSVFRILLGKKIFIWLGLFSRKT